MRRTAAAILTTLSLLLTAGVAGAEPPPEFGSDWDDPRTAAPPVDEPRGRSCEVQIVDHEFRNFDPFVGTFTPPSRCRGPWSAVVLRLEGAVAGRQFDRLGDLQVGGATIFKTSTPEPSVDGIHWTVEKDVTEYAAIFTSPQPVVMNLGNVVDDTYTGVLDIQVYLTFYRGGGFDHERPDDVLALTSTRHEGTALTGDLTIAPNTQRLVAHVYATGSGGGCEEFWYLTTPPDTGYSCPAAELGPYREVQVWVDGQIAGIAMQYPHIYTGGWSSPFLWYVLPAPRAFNVRPIEYDLSPFVGTLTDGQPHEIRIDVVGVPEGQSGWAVPATFLAWRAHRPDRVTGAVTAVELGELSAESTHHQPDGTHVVDTHGAHQLRVSGYIDAPGGRVTTTVEQAVGNQSSHLWTDGELLDELVATWTDDATVTVDRRFWTETTSSAKRYEIDGRIDVENLDVGQRITTTMNRLLDHADDTVTIGGWTIDRQTLDDEFTGYAAWTAGVPRPERHGVGETQHHYVVSGQWGLCYDHLIAQQNGFITRDELACDRR